MSTPNVSPVTEVKGPVANGATTAPEKAKRVRVPREVPRISCEPTAGEHAEVTAYVNNLVGMSKANELGIAVELPLGKVVLALALKHIRSAAKSAK